MLLYGFSMGNMGGYRSFGGVSSLGSRPPDNPIAEFSGSWSSSAPLAHPQARQGASDHYHSTRIEYRVQHSRSRRLFGTLTCHDHTSKCAFRVGFGCGSYLK